MPERCGARFRKPVTEISDRAKRYRAHSPGCRPNGPKVCYKCGSRRNVVVGHADGDESNGRKSNLRWECKRHNTIHGKAMAKAGKGVRTRQYNPRKKRRNPGAVNLAQYVQAAVDHTRKAHDEGGKIIHETPKAKRREFAREIAFRKRHNPELPASEKLSHAAVKYEHPSAHGGKSCASCVHFIAASPPRCESVQTPIRPEDFCKRYERVGSAADELYRKFHGRGPDKVLQLLIRGVDPYGNHPALTSLGPLVRLVVGEDVELSEDGEVEAASWVHEITFVPSMAEYRKLTERLDPDDSGDVRRFKAWLQSVGAPDVAGVPPKGAQLYFVGGKQGVNDAGLRSMGANPDKDLCDLGFCYLIEYFAQKRFDRFEPITYFHGFGEVSGVQPRLIYRKPQKMLELVGGEYVVKAAGIEN
jgi:hypothetical protein